MRRDCENCRHGCVSIDVEPCSLCVYRSDEGGSRWEAPVEPPAPGPSSTQLSGPPRCDGPGVVAGVVPASGCPAGVVVPWGDAGPCYVGFPDAPPEPPPEVADPYHEAKHDLGKLRWDCLPWPAVEQVVRVLTFGAEKYSAWSWPGVPDARRRYFAAAIRHAVAWLRGEKLDPESGLPHLAHLACNALFLLSFDLGETGGPAALEEPKPTAGEP